MKEKQINKIKDLLNKYNLWPKKNLGQNFLVSSDTLGKIIDSADLSANDTVVEIGPGIGTLTEALAQNVKLVLAIEKDFKLADWLRKSFKSQKNVKIIHADVLQISIRDMKFGNYKLVSNLPYNITSPVIRMFLDSVRETNGKIGLKCMVIMVQKEVAERLCAKPGDSNRGILTVMIELFGQSEIVDVVRRDCFYPMPEVDSAIIKIAIKQNNNLAIDPISFMRLVKIGFSQKRRQIHHPLQSGLKLSKPEILDILEKAGINSKLRAEDLKKEDWISLFTVIK